MVRYTRVKRSADLSSVELVSARTITLQEASLSDFRAWLGTNGLDIDVPTLVFAPMLLSRLLAAYASVCYFEQRSLYSYMLLLTGIHRLAPETRHRLQLAWRAATKWRSLEPLVHRVPVPWTLFQAMIACAILKGWVRWAAVTLAAFFGPARVGEILRAFRADMLTPADSLGSFNF